MVEQKYGASTILNIYYDTPDWRLIRASLEKPLYKEKLRLRAYGTVTDDSEVFVEIKKKFHGIVYKRRAALLLEDAREFLNAPMRTPGDEQVLREADWMLSTYRLAPAAAISYDRAAFIGKDDPDFRVTIDQNLTGRTDALDLTCGSHGDAILRGGEYLMEVKSAGGMPLWMCHLLDEYRIFPTSFSKYGTYYKTYILGRTHGVPVRSLSPLRMEVEKIA
jgi:hypothetical protein